MYKAKKLCALLCVLLAVCAAAFAVSRYEEKKEQIKNSGEVILEIAADNVTALSWENESGAFSFTKGEKWVYDADAAFPADADKINALLAQFEDFSAAFTIEEAEDVSQYGLDDPVCTITLGTADGSYTIELGDHSRMDSLRYISIGDGRVYLASHDPLEEFGAVLSDMILDDTVPEFETVQLIEFSGEENYTVVRDEDGGSICADDVYFSDGKPLDTENVDSFLSSLRALSLTEYASYNVSDAELASFGLDEPALTIMIDPGGDGGEGEDASCSFLLHLSQDPEEEAAYEEAVENGEDELPAVTCYARLGQSQIVYEISPSAYEKLTAVSFDTLRHQKLFTADFDTVESIDVSLGDESYTFVRTAPEDGSGEDPVWTYNGEEFDVYDLKTALRAVSAAGFTDETPSGQEEISLTVYLDNADFQSFTLTLYRYDGENCIAAVDGKAAAFVSRSQTVDLIEAVNRLTLGS